MRKRNIFFIILIYVILILIVTGCKKEIANNEIQTIDGDFDNILAYTALLDDSYIYFSVKDNVATYYRYYIKSKITTTIGTIENFYLNTKDVTLVDDKLYFYTSIYNSNTENGFSNILSVIDLSNNTIGKFEHIDNSLAGIPTQQYNKNIITLKNVVSDNTITTFLEIFDLENKRWIKEDINIFNSDTLTGSAIYGLYGNNESLYVLSDEYYGNNGNVNTSLKIYNNKLNVLKSIEIEESISDYIFSSRVIELAVFNEFIYIRNTSNYAILGKIIDNSIEPILMERNLELSPCQTNSMNPFFYIRNSNKCYILDVETGDISTNELQIGNDYSIMCILANEKNILLICYADDATDCMYYINKQNLDSVYIPCSRN